MFKHDEPEFIPPDKSEPRHFEIGGIQSIIFFCVESEFIASTSNCY